MLYRIINMSDRYTIECPDLAIATVACVILGSGQYAFENITDPTKPKVPMMIFGEPTEFMAEHFPGKTVNQLVHQVIASRPSELANALDSVIIGDRKEWESATRFVQPELMGAFKKEWHDQRRSSMNDIGSRAWRIAEDIRAGRLPSQKPPQQVFKG